MVSVAAGLVVYALGLWVVWPIHLGSYFLGLLSMLACSIAGDLTAAWQRWRVRDLPARRQVALWAYLNADWPPRVAAWLERVICPPFRPRGRR